MPAFSRLGGGRHNHKIEAHAVAISAKPETKSDVMLVELYKALRQDWIVFSKSAMHRFIVRCDPDT